MFSCAFLAVAVLITPLESDLVQRINTLQLENGMFLDRTSDPETVSVAATGLGAYALAYAATRGLRNRAEVESIIRRGFRNTIAANPNKNRGWLSHFTQTNGVPLSYSEVSTIDTALFYLGFLRAAELLGLSDFRAEIDQEKSKIDLDFCLRGKYFLHGFYWEDGSCDQDDPQPLFITHNWNDSSEGMILYRLFDLEFDFEVRRVDYPLFVYLYPLLFFDDPEYEILVHEALEYQTSTFGHAGFTATDGPYGYTGTDTNLISPLLLSAAGGRFPAALETIEKYSLDPAIAAYYVPNGWTTDDELTIDLASAYILLAKWNAFESQNSLSKPAR